MAGCLADEHVSRALVQALRVAGADVATVQERGLAGATDEQVAAWALQELRFLLTNDTDFLRLAASARDERSTLASVIYWPRHGRRTTRRLVEQIIALTTSGDYEAHCGQMYFV